MPMHSKNVPVPGVTGTAVTWPASCMRHVTVNKFGPGIAPSTALACGGMYVWLPTQLPNSKSMIRRGEPFHVDERIEKHLARKRANKARGRDDCRQVKHDLRLLGVGSSAFLGRGLLPVLPRGKRG
jgi:hypothetical protein